MLVCSRLLARLRHDKLLRGSDAAVAAFMRKQPPDKMSRILMIGGPGGLLRQPEHGANATADDHPRALVELTPRGGGDDRRVVVLRVVGFCACSHGAASFLPLAEETSD